MLCIINVNHERWFSDEVSVLKARIDQLEQREKELLKLKEENEAEFGQKRSRFREMFLQKEGCGYMTHISTFFY